MALTKNKSLAMIGASAVFVLMGFQNCSKVGVMDTSSGSDKVAGDGLVAGNPDGDSGSATDPNDNGGSGGTDVVTNPPAGGSGDNSGPGGNGDGDHGDHHQVQPSTPEEIREHLVELCMKSKGGPLAGPNINTSSGHLIVESDNLERVQLTSGLLLVKGKSDKSHAVHIGTTDAPIVICGMDVDEIETTSGDVTLVNCHVRKRLTMSNATLTTYHSSVEGRFDATHTEVVSVDED